MAISSISPLHLHEDSAPSSIRTDISGSSSSSPDHSLYTSHATQEDDVSLDTPYQYSMEDDDHDPSLWIDIRPTPTNNVNVSSDQEERWRPQVEGSPAIKLQIPSLLCDCVSFFWNWTFAAVEVWVDVLSAPPFPLETLQRVSIVLLGVEKVRRNLDQSTLIVFVNPDGTPVDAAAWSLGSIPHYLIWGIPGLIAVLSISFILTLQLSWGHQEEAVIATALIMLIFLEALLPLFILGCTSMFLFQQVSWETGLILLVVVWLGSTFCAHCIRRMLYQSLGHG